MSGLTGMTTRGYAESGVGRTSLGCLAGSTGSCLIGMTTFGCSESVVGSTNLGYLAGGAGGTGSSRGIGVSEPAGASRSTSIPANSSSYSAISSDTFPNFLTLYHLSHSGPYPFHLTRYSVIILRPLGKVLLFRRRLISYDFRVRVLPSTKILSGRSNLRRENRLDSSINTGSSYTTVKTR